MTDRNVDGFFFQNNEDADLAKEEIKKIKYISEKLDMNNSEAVLTIYNKMLKSNIFLTPVGYGYLRELQSTLYKCTEVPDDQIGDIPVRISYAAALKQKNMGSDTENELTLPPKKKKDFKREYKGSLFVNAVLVLMLIAMFIIALNSNNPNILNYRTAIENEYAEWEQELTAREAALREKE